MAVEIDTLPAVTQPRGAVAAAFAGAAHVARLELANTRIVVNPMEPRASVATFGAATGRITLHSGTQGTVVTRNQTADAPGIDRRKLRVVTGNIGGSLGMKAHPVPEDICVGVAARALQRPVKWTATRAESFLADTHGSAHGILAELALDKRGHFLALRFSGFGNVGAYLTGGAVISVTINATRNTVSVYRTPMVEVATKCVFTNTVPVARLPRMCWKARSQTSNSGAAGSPSSAPIAASACWKLHNACVSPRACRRTCPGRSMPTTSSSAARQASPTAATSPSWRSTRSPASPQRVRRAIAEAGRQP